MFQKYLKCFIKVTFSCSNSIIFTQIMAKRFLIIQTAFLGDVILSTPLASELKRIYPDAIIDVLVRKSAASLIENHKYIDHVITFDKSISKFKALKQTISEVRKNKYDEVINLQRFFSSGVITLFARSKKKIGFRSNPLSQFYTTKIIHKIDNGKHEVERNLETIQHHGAKKICRPSLFPSDADYQQIKPLTDVDFFCIAPASVWFTKQLPKEKWIELLDGLKGRVYILGAPSDKKLGDEILHASKNKSVKNLCGTLSLLQSAALMQSAKMNFVNDSGPLHLASALNAPVTAFFCSTIPEFGFGPLSENHKIVQIKEPLDCRPCGLHGHKSCPKGHFKCGKDIDLS